MGTTALETTAVRDVIDTWAQAIRNKDYDGILSRHAPDVVMFDVPPPLHVRGLDAYRRSWDLFFAWADDPVVFEVTQMDVTAGEDVAFAAALIRCSGTETTGEKSELDCRLTIGLRKIDGRWTIVHEHHSVPAR